MSRAAALTRAANRSSRTMMVSLWTVPVLVLGQFALLAIVPVTLTVIFTFRDAGLRPLRRWSVGLAAVYATPLAIWAAGPDRAPSLSEDMHPIFLVLIPLAALAVIARYHALRRH